MEIAIYAIIFILFAILVLWIWNNAKDFETNVQKIVFIVAGIIILGIITTIVFSISKIGIQYPNVKMVSYVRKIAISIFIPINGYVSLPYIASIISAINIGKYDDEKIKKKTIFLGIIFIMVIIIETIYLKDFQKGIIEILKNR